MKKITTLLIFIGLVSGASLAFAYHHSGQYQVIPTYSSYTYSDGCNTYRYDPYTGTKTFLYTTCTTYYTQPVYNTPTYYYPYYYNYNYDNYNYYNYSDNYVCNQMYPSNCSTNYYYYDYNQPIINGWYPNDSNYYYGYNYPYNYGYGYGNCYYSGCSW